MTEMTVGDMVMDRELQQLLCMGDLVTNLHPNREFAVKAKVNINPESFNSFNNKRNKGYISGRNGDMYVLFVHSAVFYPLRGILFSI
ncbi:hypothetical protein GYMC10_5878 [Paenibacillus sp. Y412MC10]|nr:hypothetical protein GYMC10_5878 [Paenibacillus sp. Y412MC10]ETT67834.1 hypothetical protein C172_05727 [Paenibacillus sp. FSL H8-457]